MAPRVAVAGPLLATQAPSALASDDLPITRIQSPRHALTDVQRQLGHNPDLIKIWFVSPPADLAPDLAWVRAAIRAAHAAGVRVAVHATQLRVARAVVAAGADILVHGINDAALARPQVTMLRKRKVIYVPTLMVGPRYRAVFGRHLALTAIERRLADPAVLASFADLDRLPDLPTWVGRARPQPLSQVATRNLRQVHAAGVTVAAGSDAGNIGTPHGPALHQELALMVAAGLTPMQVLTAATSGGAAVMGRADLGTLVPGQMADFVLLAADPLADILNTQRITTVVKDGVRFEPDDLVAPR